MTEDDNSTDHLTQVNDAVTSMEVRLLRNDFREFTKRMEAMLRIITDPVSGYVPRSEIEHRFAANAVSVRWALGFTIAVATLIATFVKH